MPAAEYINTATRVGSAPISLVAMMAGVRELPELQTISASSMAKIGGTIWFSVKPSATLAPVLMTWEHPVNTVVVIAMVAIPWQILRAPVVFLSAMIVIMSVFLLQMCDALCEDKSICSNPHHTLCHQAGRLQLP